MNKNIFAVALLFWCCLVIEAYTQAPDKMKDNPSTEVYVRLKKNASASLFFGNKGMSFHRLLTFEQSYARHLELGNFQITEKSAEILKAEEPLLRTFRLTVPKESTPKQFCIALMENNEVELAEPITPEGILATPNDPFFLQQMMSSTINLVKAWEISTGDTNVVIGIVDNGFDTTHPDLLPNIAFNYSEIPNDGIDNDGNGYVDDYAGVNLSWREDGTDPNDYSVGQTHGTSVAGIAGAKTNNSIGIAGVGYNCRILPIKAGKKNNEAVYYGYEGILYAALRGAKVVNCSWGSPSAFSYVNQSIVNYAVSRDVAIVAAAGNDGQSTIFYPAGYYGVMGVGETTINDDLNPTSQYGAHVDVFAPGYRTYTTSIGGGYSYFDGTSSASPIIAGVVALVRSFYPQYSAVEALEHVRRSTVNIDEFNSEKTGLLAGRVDALDALSSTYKEKTSIIPVEIQYYVNNRLTSRFLAGDTVDVVIRANNILAPFQSASFSLEIPNSRGDIEIPFGNVIAENIASGEQFNISGLKFIVKKENILPEIFRVNILVQNNESDFFLFYTAPTIDYSIIGNNIFELTAGDAGEIGFLGNIQRENRRGTGIVWRNYDNFLYDGSFVSANHNASFIVAQSSDIVLTANPVSSDFNVKASLGSAPYNTSILSAKNTNGIDIEVKKVFVPALNGDPSISILHTIKNISDENIPTPSLGYFFDIDIGPQGENNRVQLFPEAIPSGCGACAAEFVSRDGDYPVFGVAVKVFDGQPQAAGLNSGTIFSDNDLSNEEKYAMINSGVSLQFAGAGDISLAIGAVFSGELKPSAEKSCGICIAAEQTREKLAAVLQTCLGNIVSVREDIAPKSENLHIIPHPVLNQARILLPATFIPISVELFSLTGIAYSPKYSYSFGNGQLELEINAELLPVGVYTMRLISNTGETNSMVFIRE